MRDMQRARASIPAYRALAAKRFEVFTPLMWKVVNGERRQVPFISDLLFVHTTRQKLDPIVESRPWLQYRYARGGYRQPMVVPTADMERFVRAASVTANPVYYALSEITPAMLDRKIQIVGGLLNGYEGTLIAISSNAASMLVTLPGFFAVGVQIENVDYVKFL